MLEKDIETIVENRMLLEKVIYDVQIEEMMAHVAITQKYYNPTAENLETIFTFPIAYDAVLLEVNVTIGDRKLFGVIRNRPEAVDTYEEAIAEGNRAIMVEKTTKATTPSASPTFYPANGSPFKSFTPNF